MDETYISFYLKAYRIRVFVDALRGIGSPQRFCFLIDEKGSLLLLVPHEKRDFKSHRVPPKAYSGNGGVAINSMRLCKLLANRHGWDMAKSYRIPGRVSRKQGVAFFDLTRAQVIDHNEMESTPTVNEN